MSEQREAAQVGSAPEWERLSELEEYHALCRTRLEHVVPVNQPLVLVSQIQRSGGTLLSQLVDGHPECHAHPHELKIGYPRKHNWPPLDLAQPDTWFGVLFHKRAIKLFVEGYDKRTKSKLSFDVFPFVQLPRLQKAIFDACVSSRAIESERDVLDCYFTSYFNAWVDNNNLYAGPKKVVTGFTPRLAMHGENVERFFAAYPDGTLITIVRDPRAWYVSAAKWRPKYYADVGLAEALALWRRSAEAALESRERYGERVLLLTYDQLVLDTEATMTRVAERIGITMTPHLLAPTFNGMPIRANSSDAVEKYGVLPERAGAYRDELPADTIAQIEEASGDLYARAAAAAE